MKINVDYTEADVQNLKVETANYLGGFLIEIYFSDNSIKTIDFEPFLLKSMNPFIKTFLDKTKFADFKIKDGNLNWNDYELIFPVWNLYQREI